MARGAAWVNNNTHHDLTSPRFASLRGGEVKEGEKRKEGRGKGREGGTDKEPNTHTGGKKLMIHSVW